MIEIINCIYLTIFFLILFRLNFLDKILRKFLERKDISLVEIYSINILIVFIFLLFISFFNLNYLTVILILFSLNLLSLFINIKKKFFIRNSINKDYIVIFTITFIISISIVANLKLEWDGHFWYYKALNFYENLNFFNLNRTPHMGYPHLGGVIWGLFWKISFLNYEYFGRMIYVFVYVISILTIAEKITKNFNLKILFILILLLFTFDQYLFGGYQEYLLFGLIIIIFNLLNEFNLKKLSFYKISFLILSSYLLVWSKNEGLFYFSAIILYIAYFQPTNKKLILIFVFFILVFLRMFLFSKITGEISVAHLNLDFIFLQNNNFSFLNLLTEILLISKHLLIALFKYPVCILIILSLFLKRLDKKEIYIIFFTLFSVVFIYAVFLNSKADLVWHLSVTLDRLILQLSAFYMIFLSLRLNYFCKKFIK